MFSALRTLDRTLTSEQFDLLHQGGGLARQLLVEPSGRVRNQVAALGVRLNHLSKEISEAEKPEILATETNNDTGTADSVHAAALPDISDTVDVAKTDVIRVQGRNLDAIRHQAEALLSVELALQHHITELLELADDMSDRQDELQVAESVSRKPGARMRSTHANKDMTGGAVKIGGDDGQFEFRCRQLATALGRTRRHFVGIRDKLMEATLETAMVPSSSALEQLPGLVRNLARASGKEVVLDIEGGSIQIDRRILNIVREALIHLVTNAVDHGIEPRERRLANGKSAAGKIRVAVAQIDSNRIAVAVSDDGGGIDVDAIVAAALKSGNVNQEQVTGLSERQKLQLVLHVGISTSVEVTPVSGRGVGLAVVAEKAASIGGGLRIDTTVGSGCSFELLLPVRLATVRGLVLRTKGTRFVFPLFGVEAVRALRVGDIRTVENRETLLFGGRVVPAIRLANLLGLHRADSAQSNGEGVAVVAHTDGNTFALLVDEVLFEQEVLPKSLGKQLRRVRCITGAAQLGDGSLVPILALKDIAKRGLEAGNDAPPTQRDPASTATVRRLLVVEDSITSRLLLKHILESAGYAVETAIDGLQALSKLRQEDFDAVVSDIEMPHLDGLALTERIRANPKTEDLPVILVTSLQSSQEKERGLRAGADAYVVKGSFDQDNLLKTIRRLI
ncbi:hypothetical protein ASE07_25430 [Noviherbaspirillum sp. Root189]|nr:hypothetical protein ASE07_25430 [Noviherbaspirillum sp. Root189]